MSSDFSAALQTNDEGAKLKSAYIDLANIIIAKPFLHSKRIIRDAPWLRNDNDTAALRSKLRELEASAPESSAEHLVWMHVCNYDASIAENILRYRDVGQTWSDSSHTDEDKRIALAAVATAVEMVPTEVEQHRSKRDIAEALCKIIFDDGVALASLEEGLTFSQVLQLRQENRPELRNHIEEFLHQGLSNNEIGDKLSAVGLTNAYEIPLNSPPSSSGQGDGKEAGRTVGTKIKGGLRKVFSRSSTPSAQGSFSGEKNKGKENFNNKSNQQSLMLIRAKPQTVAAKSPGFSLAEANHKTNYVRRFR